ncbi:hypothetical protein K490DRAFT_60438 [Saccharata proteae CBS 121410]|uniref:histidine kinase n=1 Tax=Saccharata proteae CBS 121410 TaxID=1314787 RepID=A0A9P4HMV2_9PEZI|nr:hypothetical protein K490DRAFT_60438 [Saccharata proteae CBS 121410]
MEEETGPGAKLPHQVLLRLSEIPGYAWDTETEPFHSSYDNWHFFGVQHSIRHPHPASLTNRASSSNSFSQGGTVHGQSEFRPALRAHKSSNSEASVSSFSKYENNGRHVVARVSSHVLRLEREFQLGKLIASENDPNCEHFVRPLELVRLPSRQGGDTLVVSIFESPGPNYLQELVDLGPGFSENAECKSWAGARKSVQSSLQMLLQFAIGATESLEILHNERKIVHGEIRGDAFHFNRETGKVKMLNFGSGARSFENGLTSAGWSTLSREVGVEHKLQFIAPEQTGRLPAEPDTRTDIYSLGILMWTMLTAEPAFDGDSPLEIMQSVLSRRIPPVSSKRLDVPEALSSIISKMTAKNIEERYKSISGLKHDLVSLNDILAEGDVEALKAFKVASKDVSSFFSLPSRQIGREQERQTLINIIDNVSRNQQSSIKRSLYSFSSGSSISASSKVIDGPNMIDEIADIRSEGSSSRGSERPEARTPRNNSDASVADPTERSFPNQLRPTSESWPSGSIFSTNDSARRASSAQNGSSGTDSSDLLRQAHRAKRKSRCEVVAIAGAAGYGKSSLIQSVQPVVRSRGFYFATSKFDQAKRAPFEPVLRLMGSLFRQIFSEANISTDFHNNVRAHVQPVWHILHAYLDLPEWLLGAPTAPSADPLRTFPTAGSGRNASRLTNTFIHVLKMLSRQQSICFCIDDLQFADDESLELIESIVANRLPLVLLLTYREEEKLSTAIRLLLESGTKIDLKPFTEHETAEFVAETLHRDSEYCLPLVATIQEKTGGSPFFVREMLDACYRKKCIYYSWKDSAWQYDLDLVFAEFKSTAYGSRINNDFVAKRLQELPHVTRCLLAWASLIGTSFSFTVIKRLMSGDHGVDAEGLPITSEDPVMAIESAMAAYIIMPGDKDDRFRFSHDRYLQAALTLLESEHLNQAEMHFAISKTMIELNFQDNTTTGSKSLYVRARHVALAADLIRGRVRYRVRYRKLLKEAAENACEAGARSTGLYYYTRCFLLLQDDPWDEALDDVYYNETLAISTSAAECYWYQGFFEAALGLCHTIFAKAKTAVDKTPGWILSGRTAAMRGDSFAAFKALKQCLTELGLELEDKSWETCDEEFQQICAKLQTVDKAELLRRPAITDPNLLATGTVLVEIASAAFWSDSRLFYQMSMLIVSIHLEHGIIPQVALGYIHLATVAIGRFGMTKFGVEIANMAKSLFDMFRDDAYTVGRGQTLFSLFIGHLESHMKDQMPILEEAMNATILSADRIFSLLNMGVQASFKLWSSQPLSEVEYFVSEMTTDFRNWCEDLRGGVLLISARQYTRALLGKTGVKNAETIHSDHEHNESEYLAYIDSRASNPKRPRTIYLSYCLISLFRYGHLEEAVALGEKILPMMDGVWCMPIYYSNLFYLSLVYIQVIRENTNRADKDILHERIVSFTGKLRVCAQYNDINYKIWLEVLEAEYEEMTGDPRVAMAHYEAALDHAEIHGFALDEGLAYELYAACAMRRGATRPARRLMRDALSCYSSIGATGLSDHISEKYEFLLDGVTGITTADAGVQTEIVDTGNTSYKLEKHAGQEGHQTSADRTQAWLTPAAEPSDNKRTVTQGDLGGGFSAVGLDVIDLTGILESSHVLASELQVDGLLAKMTEIILESTGAELAAIVTEDEKLGWSIAATGGPDGVMGYPGGQTLESVDDQVARQVTMYVLRFRETVFVQNLLEDERFSSVNDAYLRRNPDGRAVIAIPILHGDNHLLGSIYCEGAPNQFSERNLTVLRLLVNSVSVSLANALLFKRIEQVSASNIAMLEMQKKSLAQARAAEIKAKEAEAVAIRNMKLKEEAAKAKALFLANVSHELRTPLNGVIGMSELLKGSKLSEDQEQYANSIRVCADTLLSVINDLLDFSKLDAGKMKVFNVPLSLTETIREVVRALSYTNLERGLETVVQLNLDNELFVLGDPVRLHQIFMNLLSNSYKFTPEGTVLVRAERVREDAKVIEVQFSVADSGIGITEEHQKKLFHPFSQVEDSSNRAYQGTGLGLSIVKAIIEGVMGGRIWLKSEIGKGTEVSFTITFQKTSKPQAPEAVSDGAPAEEVEESSEGVVAGRLPQIPREQIKVAVAEDNRINQKIAVSFVKKLGFKCEAFEDGLKTIQALEKASSESKPFHLVLMDVQMPVLDGYDATKAIREHSDPTVHNVLIIAMTASAISGDREKCLEVGMNNYLAKPVRAATLKALLESYLSQPSRKIPNLQEEATRLANSVIEEAKEKTTEDEQPARVSPVTGVQNSTPPKPPPLRKPSTEKRISDFVTDAAKTLAGRARFSDADLAPAHPQYQTETPPNHDLKKII